MLRILLVLEDYGELMFLQTVLKKIGFDVDGIQNPRGFQEAVLRLNPEIVVMTAGGKRVNGLELKRELRRVGGIPRIVLIRAAGASPADDGDVDGWLDSPVSANALLAEIALRCGLDPQMLNDKLLKLRLREMEAEKSRTLEAKDRTEPVYNGEVKTNSSAAPTSVPSSVQLVPSSIGSSERLARYQKYLTEDIPPIKGFAVKDIQNKIRELRQLESSTELADLERERRAFVEHLFRKKS